MGPAFYNEKSIVVHHPHRTTHTLEPKLSALLRGLPPAHQPALPGQCSQGSVPGLPLFSAPNTPLAPTLAFQLSSSKLALLWASFPRSKPSTKTSAHVKAATLQNSLHAHDPTATPTPTGIAGQIRLCVPCCAVSKRRRKLKTPFPISQK